MDADGIRDLLDSAIDDIRRAINALGGHVVRVQGDGVMAIFGATVVLEDHAWRAVLAGNEIRRTAKATGNAPAQAVQIRVGIHSGPIYLRWQKNDFGMILDAVGSTAHLAARTEKACPPNSVAITNSTLSMLNDPVDTHFISNVVLDEASERIEIHELGDINLAHGQRSAINRRRQTPLVGRALELQEIREFMNAIERGSHSVLATIGPAGIGKSRLLTEATIAADKGRIRQIIIRGRQLQSDQPFGALRSLFAQLMEMENLASTEQIHTYLSELGFADEMTNNLLDTLGGDQYRPGNSTRVAPDQLQKIIVEGLLFLLEQMGARGPGLLLCDDVQYLDSASRRFITRLIQKGSKIPVGLLLFGRPEITDFLASLSVAQIHLSILNEREAKDLANRILGSLFTGNETSYAHIAEQVLLRSEGLPLAIEEFSRFAGERLHSQTEPQSLPPRIDTIFRSRTDVLNEQERKLCDIACAMGVEIPVIQIEAMHDLLTDDLSAVLQSLLDQNILVDRADGRLQFSHQLLQEAAYAALSKTARQGLHAEIYARLSTAKQFAVPHIDLANNARLAGLPEPALKHYWRACEEAVAHAAPQSVVAIYREAQQICRTLGDAGQLTASRFAMLAFDAAQQLAVQEECRTDLEAITKQKITVDTTTLMIANVHMAMVNWIGGRGLEGLQNAQLARAAVTPDTALAARWYVEFTLGVMEFSNSLPREGLRRLEAVAEELSDNMLDAKFGSIISVPGFLARAFGGWMAGDLGEYAIAERLCTEASEIADRLNHNNSRLIGRIAEGYFWLIRKDYDRAVIILSEANQICREYGFDGYEPSTSSRFALALLAQGKTLQAYEVIQHSLKHGAHKRIINSSSHFLYDAEAQILDAMGETEQALSKSNALVERSAALGDGVQEMAARFLNLKLTIKLRGSEPILIAQMTALQHQCAEMGLKLLVKKIDDFLDQNRD